MPNDRRFTLRFRLEDAVALVFFLLHFFLMIVFREIRGVTVSPGDVLIILPAVSLLLAKELVHYFWTGQGAPRGPGESLREFVHPYWEIIRDWFPFFIILLMYYSLWGDATHLLFTTDRDAALIAWDQKLFGFQASVAIQRFISPPLTAWMEFAYFFHVLNIPVVACFIYARRSRRRFRELMSGMVVTVFFGLLGYVLVPAIGPLFTLRDRFTVPLDRPFSLLNPETQLMDFARIRRDCFPSLHVGLSLVVWMYAYRNSRRLFWILSPFLVSLWISTVYLRYHYLVDVLAGLILAPLCFWLADWMFKRFGEVQLPLRLPAAWAARIRPAGVSQPAEKERIEERP